MSKLKLVKPENETYQHDGITFARQIEMPFAEWCAVPDHPNQRDTIKHAARSRHLRIFSETQRKVALAILPDGTRCKCDGHTRTYMWKSGLTIGVPFNLKVLVDVYNVASIGSLEKLYDTFDNRNAVDTVADEVFSAAKSAQAEFQSPMLRSGRYASAIKIVYHAMTPNIPRELYTLRSSTNFFIEELKILDQIGPTQTEFTSGFTIAAIFTIARDGELAAEFWKSYQKGHGEISNGECDAVQALIHLRDFVRSNSKTGSSQAVEEFKQALTAYLASGWAPDYPTRWFKGKKAKPRPANQETITRFRDDILKLRSQKSTVVMEEVG